MQTEVSWRAQKELWNIAKKNMLEDRGALPREADDSPEEYKAMHEDKFLSGWDDSESKAEEVEEMRKRGPTKQNIRVERGRLREKLGIVVVVCKRACCGSCMGSSGQVFEE